jgi:hypothetical protein
MINKLIAIAAIAMAPSFASTHPSGSVQRFEGSIGSDSTVTTARDTLCSDASTLFRPDTSTSHITYPPTDTSTTPTMDTTRSVDSSMVTDTTPMFDTTRAVDTTAAPDTSTAYPTDTTANPVDTTMNPMNPMRPTDTTMNRVDTTTAFPDTTGR